MKEKMHCFYSKIIAGVKCSSLLSTACFSKYGKYSSPDIQNVLNGCVSVILKDTFKSPIEGRFGLAQICLFVCGEDHKLSVALLRELFFLPSLVSLKKSSLKITGRRHIPNRIFDLSLAFPVIVLKW